MPLKIKICGLSTPEEIAAAADAGASHVGLVHFAKSPRHLEFDEIAHLQGFVPEGVKAVVLVVDPDGIQLANITERIRPDVIQFQGSEPPEALALVKERSGIEVWKALPVRSATSLGESAAYDCIADRLLFDAPAPAGSALPGGNGEVFDWSLLKGYPHRTLWALAGGLNANNVAQAIRQTGADFIDVSSGVESAPGIKDVDKIAAFCEAARSA